MPQPRYSDGGWHSLSRFVSEPGDLIVVKRCSCPVVTGGHLVTQPTCQIHGTNTQSECIRFRLTA